MKTRFRGAVVKSVKGVDVSVNEDGTFYARVAGEYISADTLAVVEKQVERLVKKTKAKVAVPVTQLGRVWREQLHQRGRWVHGVGVRHLTLTGIHAGTDRVLMRDDQTGEAEQFSRYGNAESLVRRLTDAEIAEYVVVTEALRAARDANDAFLKKIALPTSPADLVKGAMGLKVDEPTGRDEEAAEAEALADDPRL